MDANTREIPREQWSRYFAQIERLQHDRRVKVELLDPELGDQVLAQSAELRSISLAEKGSDEGVIELDLGPDGQLDHRITHPVHVYAIQDPSGAVEYLDIEDERQTKTLLRFEHPPLLEAGAP